MNHIILNEHPDKGLERSWRDMLRRLEMPAHYVAPEYFLEPHWVGKSPFAVLVSDRGMITAVATGVHSGEVMDCGQPTRPQVVIEPGPTESAATDELARGLLKEARDASLINLYSWTPWKSLERHGYRIRELEGDVVLDLTQGPDALFNQAHPTRRRNVRFAVKNGVEVSRATTDEELREFYDVYQSWLHSPRKNLQEEGISFERFLAAQHLTANHCAMVARAAGKTVAGIMLRFYPGGLLESAANSSLDEFLYLKPNDLLLWRATEWGCAQGFRCYSLGAAHPFLRWCGGKVWPIYRHRLDRTWLRRHDIGETMSEFGREALRKMPEPVRDAMRRFRHKALKSAPPALQAERGDASQTTGLEFK